MNKYHIITLILCLFCLGGAATASPDRTAAAPDTQARSSQLKVSGIIKDDAGSPLIGVTIVVKGTSSGSVSNSDGSYTITVPYAEATLMVSYIGYAPQEIGVNNRTRIDITMVEDSKALEEVVVVGYNVQKKETITGSISTITTKDLKQSPLPTSTMRWPGACRACWSTSSTAANRVTTPHSSTFAVNRPTASRTSS